MTMITVCVFAAAVACFDAPSVEITLTSNGAILRVPNSANPIACERVEYTPSALNLRCDGVIFADGFEE